MQFSPRKFLLSFLPTFVWQTSFEILTMIEQVHEDVNPDSLNVILCDLAKKGQIASRKRVLKPGEARNTCGKLGHEYLKV